MKKKILILLLVVLALTFVVQIFTAQLSGKAYAVDCRKWCCWSTPSGGVHCGYIPGYEDCTWYKPY